MSLGCWCDDKTEPVCGPECDLIKTKRELGAEVERLRNGFADLLEAAEDMRCYVPDYFAEKWKHDEALAEGRSALSEKQA